MRRILVVDDEARLTFFVQHALERHGYLVQTAPDGATALRLANGEDFGLVILDLMLPGIDGFEVLRRLASADRPPRVLVLSAVGDVASRVRCLSMGAVDFMRKPFSVAELVARVSARLRDEPPPPTTDRWLRVGTTTLDLQRLAVVIDGRSVQLSHREFVLLEHLMRHCGEVHSRDELLAHVWGWNADEGSNVVDVCVRRLRAKLQTNSIETVRHVGYSFVAS